MSNEQIRTDSFPRPPEDDYPPLRRFTSTALRNDKSHLRTLSIFYYIAAVMIFVYGFFPGIYVAMGVLMLSGSMGPPSKGGPPPEMGLIFIFAGSVAMLAIEAFAICVLVAGRSLVTQRRYIFCFVIAVFLCLAGIPVVVLGVFSIIVLARESVREVFANGDLAFGLDPDDD